MHLFLELFCAKHAIKLRYSVVECYVSVEVYYQIKNYIIKSQI